MTLQNAGAQTLMVNAKTAFTVDSWQSFREDAQTYLMSVREQLEDTVMTFQNYEFIHEEALCETPLHNRLYGSLFKVVNDAALGLDLGMRITDSSGIYATAMVHITQYDLRKNLKDHSHDQTSGISLRCL